MRATKHAAWPPCSAPIQWFYPTRLKPWELNKVLYRERNHVERLFGRLKSFRRIFTRYDKLDVLFRSFVTLALIWLTLT
jgi:transposase